MSLAFNTTPPGVSIFDAPEPTDPEDEQGGWTQALLPALSPALLPLPKARGVAPANAPADADALSNFSPANQFVSLLLPRKVLFFLKPKGDERAPLLLAMAPLALTAFIAGAEAHTHRTRNCPES